MQLTLRQTADKLGKSIRQVCYMIQLGQLAATKVGGEWHIDVAALPTTAGQVEAALHRDQKLRATVEDALDLGDRPGRRRLDADPVRPGTGVPIGSCLSQWTANLYLDGLDHFIKRSLHAPAYLRYMDDLTLFSHDRAELLAARAAIEAWLAEHRRLALGRRRWHVHPTSEPSTFAGYRVTRMVRRMRLKVQAAASRGMSALSRTLVSYQGLARFG